MKHFIITLLSALTLSVAGFAFAGGEVVDAPVVDKHPAAQQPVDEEVVEAPACEVKQGECETEETTDISETTEEMEDIKQDTSAS